MFFGRNNNPADPISFAALIALRDSLCEWRTTPISCWRPWRRAGHNDPHFSWCFWITAMTHYHPCVFFLFSEGNVFKELVATEDRHHSISVSRSSAFTDGFRRRVGKRSHWFAVQNLICYCIAPLTLRPKNLPVRFQAEYCCFHLPFGEFASTMLSICSILQQTTSSDRTMIVWHSRLIPHFNTPIQSRIWYRITVCRQREDSIKSKNNFLNSGQHWWCRPLKRK